MKTINKLFQIRVLTSQLITIQPSEELKKESELRALIIYKALIFII